MKGVGPDWMFDIDRLSASMNYVPVTGTNTNDNAGFEDNVETPKDQDYIWMPIWKSMDLSSSQEGPSNTTNEGNEDDQGTQNQENQESGANDNGTASSSDGPASSSIGTAEPLNVQIDDSFQEEVGISNLPTTYEVPKTPSTRILKDHSTDDVIGSITSGVRTRSQVGLSQVLSSDEEGFLSSIYEEKNNDNSNICLFSCFLSQAEPKNINKTLDDASWVEAMQEELLQFKIQKVWVLVDLPKGMRVIGTKWVFRKKKRMNGVL